MRVSEQAYRKFVLEHNHTYRRLGWRLHEQLDESEFEIVTHSGRVRRSEQNYFIPDLYVVPMEQARRLFAEPGTLEAYPEPLPLVVEVWSPSTGEYDVTTKLSEYQQRGDAEIWFIHPYDRTLTAWRCQPDGSYEEAVFQGGTVQPVALPNVTIDLGRRFD